jgi:hypothetical protein
MNAKRYGLGIAMFHVPNKSRKRRRKLWRQWFRKWIRQFIFHKGAAFQFAAIEAPYFPITHL